MGALRKSLGVAALVGAASFGAMALAPIEAQAQYRQGWAAPGAARAPVVGRPYAGGRPYYGGPTHHRRGWGPGAAAAGVIGGLALGALAAGAFSAPPPPPAYEPVRRVYDPGCELTRERYWDGWRWRYRTVEVCD
jgi:hypothetical protein